MVLILNSPLTISKRQLRHLSAYYHRKHSSNPKQKVGIVKRARKLGILLVLLFCVLSLTPRYNYEAAVAPEEALANTNEVPLSANQEGFLLKSSLQEGISDHSRMNEVAEYEVRAGDTISGIADSFGIDQNTVLWANDIYSPNNLKIGQKIKILPVSGVLHTVRKNETLAQIARRYKIEEDAITKQNKLEANSVLSENAALIIPGGKNVVDRRYIASRGASAQRYSTTTKYTQAEAIRGQMKIPCVGLYTQYFHWGHYAIDIANRKGGSIFAALGGTVVKVESNGWNGGYGKYIEIDHGGGLKTMYAHLSQIYVSEGQFVVQGHPIGLMGTTGRSSGIHLHFEVVQDGAKKNPLAYF